MILSANKPVVGRRSGAASLLSGSSSAAIVRRVGFATVLSIGDRRQLRAIVRKTHAQYFRDVPSDLECDKLIDSFGPQAAAAMVLRAEAAGR